MAAVMSLLLECGLALAQQASGSATGELQGSDVVETDAISLSDGRNSEDTNEIGISNENNNEAPTEIQDIDAYVNANAILNTPVDQAVVETEAVVESEYEPIENNSLYDRPSNAKRRGAEFGMAMAGTAISVGLGFGIFMAMTTAENADMGGAYAVHSIASMAIWTAAIGGGVHWGGHLLGGVGQAWAPYVGAASGVLAISLVSSVTAIIFPALAQAFTLGNASSAVGGLYAMGFDASLNLILSCGGFLLPLALAMVSYEVTDNKMFKKMTESGISFYPAIEMNWQRTTVGVGIRF